MNDKLLTHMNKNKKDWVIISYQDGDEERIRCLYNEIYKDKFDINKWCWTYKTCPAAKEGIFIDLAIDGKILAGQYCIQPQYFSIYGIKKKAALSLDTLTHPNYQKKGIFSTLANSVYKKLADSGFSFVYGFPNTQSRYGLLTHLNWHKIKPGFHLVAPIGAASWHSGASPSPAYGLMNSLIKYSRKTGNIIYKCGSQCIAHGFSVKEVNEPSEKINSLWNNLKENATIIKWRDFEYISWRYYKNPENKYKYYELTNSSGDICGLAILKENAGGHVKRSVLMELVVAHGNSRGLIKLLSELHDILISINCGFCEVFCPPGNWMFPYLIGFGFIWIPDKYFHDSAVKAALHLGNYPPRPVDLFNSNNWFISCGDADHF